jgi:pSer/pThr/pTyr-binding forkhead associated (FHA) protein
MFAIAVNALYTTLRRRGTTRQLAGAIVTCVISALLLLPAIVWYNQRFIVEQAAISPAEVEVALVYLALFGWFLPFSVTATYCLFSLPRTSTTSMHIPRQKPTNRATLANSATAMQPPRHQPGVEAPFVFSEDAPWGWLVYRGGRFQGQRLALKRSVITIGRGEDNDIWLDDDMASRNHAELAWDQGSVYITDCDSLNGVLLNGLRIRRTALIEPGNLLEIGSHHFLFEKAERPGVPNEQDDPLARHVWHSTVDLPADSEKLSMTPSSSSRVGDTPSPSIVEAQDTAQITPLSALPQPPGVIGVFMIRDGERAGQSFALDRPVITIGRGSESDVVINDVSISRLHAQVLRQANGNYVQDLASRNGTKVNDEPLNEPRLLQHGDIVCLGSVRLEYASVQVGLNTPVPEPITPPSFARSMRGPVPLRLPSRPREP